MNKDNVKTLAKIILDTATVKESSYDNKSADEAGKLSDCVDYNQFYLLDLRQSAIKACEQNKAPTELAELIDYALSGWWNDVIAWAEQTLEEGDYDEE